jgi:predicted nucleic acid-binding protein
VKDFWIAAACLLHELTLASLAAHFEVVEGLRLVRWEVGSTEK